VLKTPGSWPGSSPILRHGRPSPWGKRESSPNYGRPALRLPDLDHCPSAVLNSLGSPASGRVYEYAIDQFIAWYPVRCPQGRTYHERHCDHSAWCRNADRGARRGRLPRTLFGNRMTPVDSQTARIQVESQAVSGLNRLRNHRSRETAFAWTGARKGPARTCCRTRDGLKMVREAVLFRQRLARALRCFPV
jgi:hypothetical protein